MSNRNAARARLIAPSLALVAVVLCALPLTASAGVLTMSPHRIVLNAQGDFPDMQAVIRQSMPGGYTLGDYRVILSVEGTEVSEAFNLRYCYIDDNFLASFDRTAFQLHPAVIALANAGPVQARVEGWYEATNADGDVYRGTFDCTSRIEIVDPKKAPN